MRQFSLSLLVATLAWTAGPAAQAPKAEELVARAGAYVGDFVAKFSGVVAEEDSRAAL